MRRLILVAALLLSVLAVENRGGAVQVPESCLFDPAMGGSGLAITPDPADGYSLNRLGLDRSGRLYTISNRVLDSGVVVDRVRRFRTDGTSDVSWGTSGFVDLPGETTAVTGRALAIDDQGRVWVLRDRSPVLREVIRLTAEGTTDPTLGLVEFPFGGVVETPEPVTVMAADGDGVVLAYSYTNGTAYGVVDFVRLGGDGTQSKVSQVFDGARVIVTSVHPSGWIAGTAIVDDVPSPFLFESRSGSLNAQQDPYLPVGFRGLFTSVSVNDGIVTAIGSATLPDGSVEAAIVLEVESGWTHWTQDRPPSADQLSRSAFAGTPLAHFPGGAVIGFQGPSDAADLFVGEKSADGEVIVTTTRSEIGLGAFPTPAVVTRLGTRVAAGFSSYDNNQAFVLGLTPELGPTAVRGALTDQIARLYRAYFLRAPDEGGLSFWRELRSTGWSLSSISDHFAAAPEFIDLYGNLTDAEFVDLVYANVLDRPGETIGRQFWTEQLATGQRTRGSVMLEFSESNENIEATGTIAPHDTETGIVHRLYRAYFGRDPDRGGSCFWVRRLVSGDPAGLVSDSFAASQEFLDTYGSLSDAEFVELVYQNVLGRAGERTGVEFWTAELESNRRSRGEVMTNFSESPENVLRTDTIPD